MSTWPTTHLQMATETLTTLSFPEAMKSKLKLETKMMKMIRSSLQSKPPSSLLLPTFASPYLLPSATYTVDTTNLSQSAWM